MTAGKGYPKGLLKVPTVTTDAWASQHEAARILGVSVGKIGVLIATDHLTPAHNPAGEAGVTRVSLFEEVDWRTTATISKKMRRLFKDSIKFM
ncbi:DNA-binding protein [Streptomyces sp. A1277]|uniref:DNA-binding protein n=1 Tax=Streptomyces sp. A1277 TaxID=2563103 RepID=UPI0010A26670|nr:DNA-binding protein [Streptomyces sp. A1277]THA32119.1 DNA-binding protein [Streptomyces sp. A1277]